jgi:hypothetical protein
MWRSTGAAMAFGLWHIMLLVLALQGNLVSDRPTTIFEMMLVVFAYFEHYVSAILVLATAWGKELNTIKSSQLLQNQVIFYLLMLPLITSFICLLVKYFKDCQLKQISRMTLGLAALTIVNLIAFIVLLFIYKSTEADFVLIGAGVVFLFLAIQFSLYSTKDYELHVAWYIIDGVIILGVALALLIALASSSDISKFASSSIMLLFICCVLLLCLAFVTYKNAAHKQENPIFYSAWVMPVYQYYSSKNDVQAYYTPLLLGGSVVGIFMMWALGTTFMVSPCYFGIGVTCIVQCILFVMLLWCITYSVTNLQEVKSCVDKDIVKQAWLHTKKNFVNTLNLGTRMDYVTYQDWWKRRFNLMNHIRLLKG